MQGIRERHGKTPMQKEFSVVIKKAYCGFDRLEKQHEAKMQELLNGIRRNRLRPQTV